MSKIKYKDYTDLEKIGLESSHIRNIIKNEFINDPCYYMDKINELKKSKHIDIIKLNLEHYLDENKNIDVVQKEVLVLPTTLIFAFILLKISTIKNFNNYFSLTLIISLMPIIKPTATLIYGLIWQKDFNINKMVKFIVSNI